MKKQIFVTGISTDVGKTLVSAILVEALKADYWKPIQSGDLAYSDTDKVKELIGCESSVFFKNAYGLKTPMSPHASAAIDGVQIELDEIVIPQTDKHLIIEGAGGVLVPINDSDTVLDLIPKNSLVVLVSRHYLGSINHTLMSVEILKQKGYEIALIFSGNEHKTTEDIILKKTNLPVIGRIDDEKEITQDLISKYANLFKQNVLDELSK